MKAVYEAIEIGKSLGMHQHDDEIRPFAEWLQSKQLANVLEIGSLRGGTMAVWGCLTTGKLVSLDLPNGEFGGLAHHLGVDAMFERNLRLAERFPGRFEGILGDSHDPYSLSLVREAFGGEPVDFLFIDGDHTFEGVKRDFEMYSPLVRPGGVVAFHDILDTPLHRDAGCRVDLFWSELIQEFTPRVFSIDSNWGGIGAITMEFRFQGDPVVLHGEEKVL